MKIKYISGIVLFVLFLAPFASYSQTLSAVCDNGYIRSSLDEVPKKKPILFNPLQVGTELMLQWEKKDGASSYEVRLYEAIADNSGNFVPDLINKPILADIIAKYQVQVDGDQVGLQDGHNYCFVVFESSIVATSTGGIPKDAVISQSIKWYKEPSKLDYPDCLFKVYNIEATNTTTSSIKIQWQSPSDPLIDEFILTIRDGSSIIQEHVISAANSTNEFIFQNLMANKSYCIQIKINCKINGSTVQANNFGTYKANEGGCFFKTKDPCPELELYVDYSDECGTKVHWVNPSPTSTTLTSLQVLKDGNIINEYDLTSTSNTYKIFNELEFNNEYIFILNAICTYQSQSISKSQTQYIIPAKKLSNPLVQSATPCSVVLTWTNLDQTHITKIEVYQDGGLISTTPMDYYGGQYTLYTLDEGKTYVARIYYDCGSGENYLEFPQITIPSACEAPEVSIEGVNTDKVRIVFDGNASPSNLFVCYKVGSSSSFGPSNYTLGETISNLAPSTTYTFFVTFQGCPNLCGPYNSCEEYKMTTLTYTTPCRIPSVIKADRISSTSIGIKWTPTGNATVEYRKVGDQNWIQSVDAFNDPMIYTASFFKEGLTNNSAYEFKVSYVNCSFSKIEAFSTPAADICLGNPTKAQISYSNITKNEIQIQFPVFDLNNEFECEIKETKDITANYTAVQNLNSGNQFKISGLQTGTDYSIRIRRFVANNGTGCAWVTLDQVSTQDVECPALVIDDDRAYETGSDFIKLTWTDRKSPTNYEILYRIEGTTDQDWKSKMVSGLTYTIPNLVNNTVYEIKIRRVCAPTDFSEWVELDKQRTKTEAIKKLPGVLCGSAMQVPTSTASSSAFNIPELNVGDVIFYKELAIIITDFNGGVQKVTTQPCSGKGEMQLPFGNKKVKVVFSGITVTKIQIASGGSVSVEQQGNVASLLPNTIAVNSFTCDKPKKDIKKNPNGTYGATNSTKDPHGFEADGKYKGAMPSCLGPTDKTDPMLDPRGFAQDGTHFSTHTKFDPYGCDIDGLDAGKQPCSCYKPCTCPDKKPYYWLNNNVGVTTEGTAFATEKATVINDNCHSILDSLSGNMVSVIADISVQCAGIRTILDPKIGTLGLNRAVTFGAQDKYFAAKMNEQFNTEPTAIDLDGTQRQKDITSFEKKWVDLYTCDAKLSANAAYKEIIETFRLSDEEFAKIVSFITEQTRTLEKDKIDEFRASPWRYKVWMVEKILEYLKGTYRQKFGKDFGWVKTRPYERKRSTFPELEKPFIPPYENDLATANNDMRMIQQASVFSMEDALFQYKQGWDYIHGIPRIVFLEAITKAKPLEEFVEDAYKLPLSYDKSIGDVNYALILDNLVLTGERAKIDVYLVITLSDGKKIKFKGANIEFAGGGLAPGSQPRLALMTNFAYGINHVARIVLKGGMDNTFATFSCDGFESLSTKIDIEFCREYVKPLDANNKVIADETAMVRLSTETLMQSWGDFEIKMADQAMNFVMTGYEDYKIKVKTIIIDNSPTRVPRPEIKFPENYGSPDIKVDATTTPKTVNALPSWKGLFLGEISVSFPSELFKSKGSNASVFVENMIIDDYGLTGVIGYTKTVPFISIDQGNLGGWAFSVNGIHVDILNNNIVGGGFDGLLNVPIFSGKSKIDTTAKITKDDCFAYRADYIPGLDKFTFTVKAGTNDTFKIDMLKSIVYLSKDSRVDLIYQDSKLTVTAALNGKIQFGGQFEAGKTLGGFQIGFQNFKIANRGRRFQSGTFEIPKDGGLHYKGFGVTYKVGDVKTDPEDTLVASMVLGAGFRLTEEGGGKDKTKLAADGAFKINGIYKKDANDRQRFVYKSFQVMEIHVNGSFPGVEKLEGYIKFFENDQKFGDGFQGGIDVKFTAMGIEAKTVGCFGKFQDYKYFFIDAMVYSDQPLVTLGAIAIDGLGGGAYYHMSRDTTQFNSFTLSKDTPIPTVIGKSLTGISYVPDNAVSIGIRLMLGFSLPKAKTAVNGNLLLGVEFSSSGSLNEISLLGNANIMATIDLKPIPKYKKKGGDPDSATATANKAPIRASVDLRMRFGANPEFHCATLVYMNIDNILVGGNSNGVDLLGGFELHIDKKKWYFYLGEPAYDKRVRMKLQMPGSPSTSLATIGTYFDIGSVVPDFPGLPPNIQASLGSTYKAPNSTLRSNGSGFAFGADLSISTGDKKFLIFYGSFTAEMGFDVMLKDYGKKTVCSNTGKPIGMNGWYATGQLYAGVQAVIGLKWKSIKYEILKMSAAVAFQAKLPNPFWAQGNVGGSYSICGGLKKGQCSFQLTLGEECTLPAGSDQNLLSTAQNIVSNVTPSIGDVDMSVLTTPQIEFNFPLNSKYIDEDNGNEYFAQFSQFPVLKDKFNNIISYDTEDITKAGVDIVNVYKMIPRSILEGNMDYSLSFKVVLSKNGADYKTEEKTITFKTGEPILHIPSDNVSFSYPINGQYNFYRNEDSNGNGIIKLKIAQGYLFKPIQNGIEVENKMVFTAKNGTCFMTNATTAENDVKGEKGIIKFPVPADKLSTNQIYRMQLVTIAKSDASAMCIPEYKYIRTLYTGYFRTSTYNSISDKIDAAFSNQSKIAPSASNSKYILRKNSTAEPFDQFEISGIQSRKPLLEFSANLEQALSPLYQFALNKVTGKEPYKISLVDVNRTYKLQLTNDGTIGHYLLSTSANSSQRGQNDSNNSNPYAAIKTCTLVQTANNLPLILPSNFTTNNSTGNIDQYLRFDAIAGTFEAFKELKSKAKALKLQMLRDLIEIDNYTKEDAEFYLNTILNENHSWFNNVLQANSSIFDSNSQIFISIEYRTISNDLPKEIHIKK
ncbi:MAG: hypothetical protein ACOYOA_10905 [Saprospiraceae bacterium]